MLIFRKFIGYLIFLVLIIALVALGLATSFRFASEENRVSGWIDRPAIYKVLINKFSSQANASISTQYNISGLNSFVTQNISSVYPESTFSSNVNSIINSNYSWLEGHSSKPSFAINYGSYKNNLANEAGNYIVSSTENLPLCSSLQLIEIQNNGPGSVNCLPPTINPKSFSKNVQSEIENSNLFINSNYLTADNVALNDIGNNQPYYLQYNTVPKAYKWAQLSPYILFAAILVLLLLLIFIYPIKRTAFKIFAWALLLSGAILLASTTATSTLVSRSETSVANSTTFSAFKGPADSFILSSTSYLDKLNRYFGYAYLILALIIFLSAYIYLKVRQKKQGNEIVPYVNNDGGEGGIRTLGT